MDFNPEGGVSDDGWYAGGSSKIAMFHFFAEYDDVGNYTFWNAGLGWHGLLGKPADLYFQAQYNGIETDAANVSDHDGYEVSGGVRWKIFNWLEVKGQLNWADYGDAGEVWSGDAGVLFSVFKDRLGFGADVIVAENANTVRGYIRWSFR
jgi:hypothetical protein